MSYKNTSQVEFERAAPPKEKTKNKVLPNLGARPSQVYNFTMGTPGKQDVLTLFQAQRFSTIEVREC